MSIELEILFFDDVIGRALSSSNLALFFLTFCNIFDAELLLCNFKTCELIEKLYSEDGIGIDQEKLLLIKSHFVSHSKLQF